MGSKCPYRLLVGCEGKTEALYLSIIKKVFNAYMLEVCGEFGELYSLVDNLCIERRLMAKELCIDESEIEVWAVCDDDNRGVSYIDLLKYCNERGVKLAYSRPQFESFLLQHFSPSKLSKQSHVLKKIEEIAIENGCDSYDKGDLDWLEGIIMDSPGVIDIAIYNSNIRNNRVQSPFLTFQNLVIRIREVCRAN